MASSDALKDYSDLSQECATLFLRFKDHLPSSLETAVTTIVTELWRLSKALLVLRKSVDDPRNGRFLSTIDKEQDIVSRSIKYTLRDLRRHTTLVEELRERGLDESERARDAYAASWKQIAHYFLDEGDRINGCETLAARLESYIQYLQDLKSHLEGDSKSRDYKDLGRRIDKLLHNQDKSLERMLGMGRLSLGPDVPKFEKQKSWERKRPEDTRRERLSQRPRNNRVEARKPRLPPRHATNSESSYDLVDSTSDEYDMESPDLIVGWEHDDDISGIPEIMQPRFAEPPGRRPAASPYSPHRPTAPSMGYFAPVAPEAPYAASPAADGWSSSATPSTLSSETGSSQMDHWIPEVFSSDKPSTRFRKIGADSRLVADHESGVQSHLREEYEQVIKMPWRDEHLDLYIFIRYDDMRAKILVRQDRGKRSFVSCRAAADLRILRTESCLQLCEPAKPDRSDRRGGDERAQVHLWTLLNFPTYERMVLFWCTFHALKAQDVYANIPRLDDAALDGEVCLFSCVIHDDSYQHALHLFRDRDSGGIRLQASALTGELKRCPVWTAFITHQVWSRNWAKRAERKKIRLLELKRFIFTDGGSYEAPTGPHGEQVIEFMRSADAEKFLATLQDITTRVR